jgi:UDP-N-acetylglucosamine 2-epimerase (non-hydrolysing)
MGNNLPKNSKILLVFGTRPEAIKMAPLVKQFQTYTNKFVTEVCVTGQHREMLDQVLDLFDIIPDYDLNIMQSGQDLYDVTAKVLLGMRDVLNKSCPDCVLVHGDTTTSTAAALAAFYMRIPVGHIEAGLRTHNIYSPWPEEMNRQLTGRIATYNFAPTKNALNNLTAEGIDINKIVVTGNTVIDALSYMLGQIKSRDEYTEKIVKTLLKAGYDTQRLDGTKKLVVITGHRRENFGEGFLNICNALKKLSQIYPEVDFVYPMHLNPNVRKPIHQIFGESTDNHSNVFLIEPLEYLEFVYLMSHAYMVLTDSGGIQEEACCLSKPVLVMRDTTERPEAIEAGLAKLVGTDFNKIVSETSAILSSTESDNHLCLSNPYGDGTAAKQIVEYLAKIL